MKKTIILLLCISYLYSSIPDERGYIVKTGDKIPEFVMEFPDGSQIKSEDLLGNVTMLQFTASWCSVCREEMPHIEKEIWKIYKKVGIKVIGIDRDEPAEIVKKFAKEVKVTYPIALDPEADIFALFADRNSGVTRNVIIDTDGTIVFLTRLFDPKEYLEMKKVIHSLLKNQFLVEKQDLIAQKQILKQLKSRGKPNNLSSINKIRKKIFLLESELNLKERRLRYAQKLL
ncbi:TlpA family protein disulfide reductase [bacterium]|nr:MAG: TlpA family protein disulfide reductase [bacterium]|tara:strand:- start:253 stop:942 length:690 start_codon:yes stop_codon:yes gene_type:complete